MNDLLNPFNGVGSCPACGCAAHTRVYCEVTHARGISDRGVGRYLNVGQVQAEPLAHLHVICDACQYEWLERLATNRGDY